MNFLSLPTYSKDGLLQAVIEIPAGTNQKFEYHTEQQAFLPDFREGLPRIIDFLPYPVNYGFIPSTRMTVNLGGDGDPLDVLLVSETLPRGSVVDVIPIGLLKLMDTGALDHKVLAVPADTNRQIITARSWRDFTLHYGAARQILETFFLHYDGIGTLQLLGWGDETEAIDEIAKWKLPAQVSKQTQA